MTRRKFIHAVLAVAVMLPLGGCELDVNSPAMSFLWHDPLYPKLTVQVETPQGIKTGFSVIEIKWGKGGGDYNIKGEAVAVDLPNGETLFVLLKPIGNDDWTAHLRDVVELKSPSKDQAIFHRQIAANRDVWPVPRTTVSPFGQREILDNYPTFVRFKDIADPKSVEQVDPDDLAKSFGAGYKLKSYTLQMTDEKVTVGIEKRLKWMKDIANSNGKLIPMQKHYVDGMPRYKPVPGYDESLVGIGVSYFTTEIYK